MLLLLLLFHFLPISICPWLDAYGSETDTQGRLYIQQSTSWIVKRAKGKERRRTWYEYCMQNIYCIFLPCGVGRKEKESTRVVLVVVVVVVVVVVEGGGGGLSYHDCITFVCLNLSVQ